MKKSPKDIGSRIAFAGVGAAVSIVFIVLGYFVGYLSLSCTVLTSVGILLPLSKEYYKEAVLAAIVAGVVGFFIVNIKIIPYAMASGPYVVLTVFLQQKFSDKTWKIALSYLLKLGYSALVFWICYSLISVIAVDVNKLSFLQTFSPAALYAVINIVFSLAFLFYDFLLNKGYEFAKERVKKIGRN